MLISFRATLVSIIFIGDIINNKLPPHTQHETVYGTPSFSDVYALTFFPAMLVFKRLMFKVELQAASIKNQVKIFEL